MPLAMPPSDWPAPDDPALPVLAPPVAAPPPPPVLWAPPPPILEAMPPEPSSDPELEQPSTSASALSARAPRTAFIEIAVRVMGLNPGKGDNGPLGLVIRSPLLPGASRAAACRGEDSYLLAIKSDEIVIPAFCVGVASGPQERASSLVVRFRQQPITRRSLNSTGTEFGVPGTARPANPRLPVGYPDWGARVCVRLGRRPDNPALFADES